MLTAIILICSLATTPDIRDCTVANAADVMRAPGEYALPTQCFMRGQAFFAETSIAADLRADDVVKIVCVHERRAEVR